MTNLLLYPLYDKPGKRCVQGTQYVGITSIVNIWFT